VMVESWLGHSVGSWCWVMALGHEVGWLGHGWVMGLGHGVGWLGHGCIMVESWDCVVCACDVCVVSVWYLWCVCGVFVACAWCV